jgi:LysM repeat protein
VKRTDHFRAWLLTLLLAVLVLALTACERPLQSAEELAAPTPVPQIPLVIPTPLPAVPETPPEGLTPDDTVIEPPPAPVEEGPTPGADPVAPPATDTPPTATGPVTYVVQSGDTLGRIAQRYNVTIAEIAAANNLPNVHRLDVGQVLTIPVAGSVAPAPVTEERVHIVQAGETLFRIGLRYGFTADELAAYNNLPNAHRIYVGQEIRIPPSQ